jgi:transposase, IS5 family
MLRAEAGQTDSLFDLVLPEPLRDLPADLAAIDELLKDDAMLAPFRAHWAEEVKAGLIGSSRWGRPTIPMASYVRLMVLKHRYGWGYEVLVREVSDSLHLRRFCGIPLHEGGPDESTVRKMTKRLGPEVVDELIRSLIKKATSERRLRLRAMRCDSIVLEADIRFPTDINLVDDAVRTLVRVAGKAMAAVPGVTAKVRNRGRAIGKRVRTLGRTLQRSRGAGSCT